MQTSGMVSLARFSGPRARFHKAGEISHKLTSRERAQGDSAPRLLGVGTRPPRPVSTAPVRIPPAPRTRRAPPAVLPPRASDFPRLVLRGVLGPTKKTRRRCDRRGPRCPPQPTVARQLGSARAGPDRSRRQPRPAPGMRGPLARARARARRRGHGRASNGPSRHGGPPTPNCLPISPRRRRTATASRHSPLPARPPPRRSPASGPPLPPRPQPTCPP